MSANWNISGLIIEGICGTGKTTLLSAIVQSDRLLRKSFLSTIVLTEHQTQRVLERKERTEGLTKADNIALLDHHLTYMEQLAGNLEQMPWCRNARTNMRVLCIFERFHLTHASHYAHMDWNDVRGVDARLKELNCKICLLTMDNSILWKRITDGRDSVWRDYLKRYGNTSGEIVEHFLRQQVYLRDLCEESQLNALEVNTTDIEIEKATEQILDFWGAV